MFSETEGLKWMKYHGSNKYSIYNIICMPYILHKILICLCFAIQVYSKLEDYVNEGGSVATLLLTGSAGNGKSTILAKWCVIQTECTL